MTSLSAGQRMQKGYRDAKPTGQRAQKDDSTVARLRSKSETNPEVQSVSSLSAGQRTQRGYSDAKPGKPAPPYEWSAFD